jgi:putative zinc finger protein
MDCTTARLLLECARPNAAELDAAEADALERHLAGCPACDRLARDRRRTDDALGRAMRQVQVPAGLREQVLHRLDRERAAWHRRRIGRALRWVAAAAAVVLLSWGGWLWLAARPPRLDPEYSWKQANDAQPNKAEVEEAFRRLDVPMAAPDLNFVLLIAYGLGEVPGYPGRVVPQLVFHRQAQDAVVYVIDTQRFGLPPQAGEYESPTGLRYRLHVLGQDANPYQDGERFAFLVLHNGDDLNWLRPAEPPA